MRKRRSSILWGILIIAVAVLILLENFGFDFVIDKGLINWWALFIVVPSIVSLFEKPSFWNVGALLVGLVFMFDDVINSLKLFPFELSDLIWPIILIFVGLSIIFHRGSKSSAEEHDDSDKDYTEQSSADGVYSYSAVFSGDSYRLKDALKSFKASAVFGGLDFDLGDTHIEDGAHLKLTAVFGGIEIIVPKDINLIINGTPVFGGIDAKGYKNPNNVVSPVVYLDYTCTFGGIDIRSAK